MRLGFTGAKRRILASKQGHFTGKLPQKPWLNFGMLSEAANVEGSLGVKVEIVTFCHLFRAIQILAPQVQMHSVDTPPTHQQNETLSRSRTNMLIRIIFSEWCGTEKSQKLTQFILEIDAFVWYFPVNEVHSIEEVASVAVHGPPWPTMAHRGPLWPSGWLLGINVHKWGMTQKSNSLFLLSLFRHLHRVKSRIIQR